MSKLLRKITWPYRNATSTERCLPDFIIIGVQKAGTSSLYSYLRQHPQLVPSFKKEAHFFDGGIDPSVDNFEKGIAWYRAHFPLKKSMEKGQKTFEASPLYSFNPLAPRRIFELLPDIKLIAVLRNPTQRAVSHYFDQRQQNKEFLSIDTALKTEEKRLEAVVRKRDYKSKTFRYHSYKSRGLYSHQFQRYLNYFAPEQMLILESNQLFRSPNETLKRVFAFVGVDPSFEISDLRPLNVTKDKTHVPSDIYEYLDEYFAPHNQALYELIGERYDW